MILNENLLNKIRDWFAINVKKYKCEFCGESKFEILTELFEIYISTKNKKENHFELFKNKNSMPIFIISCAKCSNLKQFPILNIVSKEELIHQEDKSVNWR